MSWVLAAALIGCPAQTVDTESPPPPPETAFLDFQDSGPRHLLMISADTLRRDHVGIHSQLGLTPFIDQLMAEGAVLEDFSTCSNWTFGGVLCSLTGRDNEELGFVPHISRSERVALPDGVDTLATELSAAGFFTTLVSTNSYLSDTWNTDQGYERSLHESYVPAEEVVDQALEEMILQQADGRPRFLHLHLRDSHVPYAPPAEYLDGLQELDDLPWDLSSSDEHYAMHDTYSKMGEDSQALVQAHLQIRYRGTVAYQDDQLRRLWSELEALGALDDTLVVFWTDHGEQFWEHGNQTHAYSLHVEENAGVGFFWAKNLSPALWTGQTSQIDLAPTLLQALGLPIPDSFTGIPVGEAAPDRPIFSVADTRLGPTQSVQLGDSKLIYLWSGEKTLFHRDSDPEELTDRYDADDPEVLALWDLLSPRVEAVVPLLPSDSPVDPGP